MRHITGRAVRTVLGTVAALATLALPLVLTHATAPSQGAGSGQVLAIDWDTLTDPGGTDTGSWVWDDQE
ncbi:hypothetical protein ACIBVL_34010 [Streptomyces sp. NPDC049687]|uniref:hypothetical protein n=1 Tax=Streptomyces sp. NPDC049687 TaxID=3365596 RepID=UPI0037B6E87E